jgi:DNA polymerase
VNAPGVIPVRLAEGHDYAAWRAEALRLWAMGAGPEDVAWGEGADLFGDLAAPAAARKPSAELRVPRAFPALARTVLLHDDPGRWGLLYRLLWRLQQQPRLLEDSADPDVRAAEGMARTVRREMHKMRAFLRFRVLTEADGSERHVAWFEPRFPILRATAAFFVKRFSTMRWSILTPLGSLHWDGESLAEGPPARRGDAPAEDAAEDLWRTYYASIFNPARLKVGAMLKEMPRRYWANMPEAALIPALVAGAQAREAAMVAAGKADRGEAPTSLKAVSTAIQQCRMCPIGCNGTRAVMGEGPAQAPLMIVGEQPGDHEEASGQPFVGPAGQVLRGALDRAGLAIGEAYVTNAVKHFKFTPTAKRRLHQTPTAGEIDTCRWWLDGERALVRPRLILALGASAARGLLGRTVSVGKERGRGHLRGDGSEVWLTSHPSYLLRLQDEGRRVEEARFMADLHTVAERVKDLAEKGSPGA